MTKGAWEITTAGEADLSNDFINLANVMARLGGSINSTEV